MYCSRESLEKVADLIDNNMLKKEAGIYNLIKALGGAGKSVGNYIGNKIPNALGDVLGNGLTGRQAIVGLKQMGSAFTKNDAVRQGRFNAGLRNFASGLGKTALTYGAGIYGVSNLMGNRTAQPNYYGQYPVN